jgi:hypothetical protein
MSTGVNYGEPMLERDVKKSLPDVSLFGFYELWKKLFE